MHMAVMLAGVHISTEPRTLDGELGRGPYELAATTTLQPGLPLAELIGGHVSDLENVPIADPAGPGTPRMGLPAIPRDGWRVIAGSIPPSQDQRLTEPPWPSHPECALAAPWPERSPDWVVLYVGRTPTRVPLTATAGRRRCSSSNSGRGEQNGAAA